MKKTLALFLLLLISFFSFADTSGTGCKINSDYVYTQELGMASPYGPGSNVRYFNSNGPKIPIYWGSGHNQYQGYRCGFINIYQASSYYDYNTKQNVPIPAEDEIVRNMGGGCAIAPNLSSQPIATDTYVAYTYNRTNKCAVAPPLNTPIDDYVWVLVLISAGIGLFLLKNENIRNYRSL